MDLNAVHPLNAYAPIVSTVDFMVTTSRAVQPKKVLSAMALMPEGKAKESREVQSWNAFFPIDVSRAEDLNWTDSRAVHPLKAPVPMVLRLAGITIVIREAQPEKALLSIDSNWERSLV